MPKKILIVEDEANIRELLRLYLEREGYTVLEAENGVEEMCIRDRCPRGDAV